MHKDGLTNRPLKPAPLKLDQEPIKANALISSLLLTHLQAELSIKVCRFFHQFRVTYRPGVTRFCLSIIFFRSGRVKQQKN